MPVISGAGGPERYASSAARASAESCGTATNPSADGKYKIGIREIRAATGWPCTLTATDVTPGTPVIVSVIAASARRSPSPVPKARDRSIRATPSATLNDRISTSRGIALLNLADWFGPASSASSAARGSWSLVWKRRDTGNKNCPPAKYRLSVVVDVQLKAPAARKDPAGSIRSQMPAAMSTATPINHASRREESAPRSCTCAAKNWGIEAPPKGVLYYRRASNCKTRLRREQTHVTVQKRAPIEKINCRSWSGFPRSRSCTNYCRLFRKRSGQVIGWPDNLRYKTQRPFFDLCVSVFSATRYLRALRVLRGEIVLPALRESAIRNRRGTRTASSGTVP